MATDNSKIILGLPNLPSDELNPQTFNELLTVYRAIRNLLAGVSQTTGIDPPLPAEWNINPPSATILTGNATRLYPIADVDILAGQVVNLHGVTGELRAGLASAASSAAPAHGVALTAAAAGQQFEMQWLRAYVTAIGGMAVGTTYWLSTLAGSIANLPPLAVGTIRQPIGLAVGPAAMIMDIPLSFVTN
jgi:hypothetical protein